MGGCDNRASLHSKDGHHPFSTCSTIHEFGSQKFLPDRNLALNFYYQKGQEKWWYNNNEGREAELLIPKLIDDQAEHSGP